MEQEFNSKQWEILELTNGMSYFGYRERHNPDYSPELLPNKIPFYYYTAFLSNKYRTFTDSSTLCAILDQCGSRILNVEGVNAQIDPRYIIAAHDVENIIYQIERDRKEKGHSLYTE
jgi:hypothetical protein